MSDSFIELFGLTSAEFALSAKERVGRGAGVAREMYRGAVQEGVFSAHRWGLNRDSADRFDATYRASLPQIVRRVEQPGLQGLTTKLVLRLHDGLEAEVVHIPMGRGRHTLCVSSQVGCKMGCQFCETAKMGLVRHLETHEIVGQVMAARHDAGLDVRNVVFMGMGEALDNYDALVQTIRVLSDPGGAAMGQERFTVCTVGHVEGIQRLAAEGFKRLNLSVSLNATTDEARRKLMPIARKYDLKTLQDALVNYQPRANFCLGVNYCLMPGINDSIEDVSRIRDFCAPMNRTMVNLIPYNPGSLPLTRAPEEHEIERFVGWLRDEGLSVRRRITKGRDVMAACGQLGNLELRRSKRALPLSPATRRGDQSDETTTQPPSER